LGRGAQVMWSKVALAQQLCCPQKGPLKHSMRSGLVGNGTATPIGIFSGTPTGAVGGQSAQAQSDNCKPVEARSAAPAQRERSENHRAQASAPTESQKASPKRGLV
jgi:hypothetical protein